MQKVKYKFTVLVALLVAWCSLRTINIDPTTFITRIPHIDKVVHLVMYIVLAGTCRLESTHIVSKVKNGMICVVCPMLYGGIMELLQEYFFPQRTGDWMDFGCNAVGVLVGYVVATYWVNKRNM